MTGASTVLAWHGNSDLKTEALNRMRAHAAADELIRGHYVIKDAAAPSGFRGCFHGCLTAEKLQETNGQIDDDPDSGAVLWTEGERLWGIPVGLGKVLDALYESTRDHAAFAVATIAAIPVGADLNPVVGRWLLDVLRDPGRGAVRYVAAGTATRDVLDLIISLFRRWLVGDKPDHAEWLNARNHADLLSPPEGMVLSGAGMAMIMVGNVVDFCHGNNADAAMQAANCVASLASFAGVRDQFVWLSSRMIYRLWAA